jgi:hypothetical protein
VRLPTVLLAGDHAVILDGLTALLHCRLKRAIPPALDESRIPYRSASRFDRHPRRATLPLLTAIRPKKSAALAGFRYLASLDRGSPIGACSKYGASLR